MHRLEICNRSAFGSGGVTCDGVYDDPQNYWETLIHAWATTDTRCGQSFVLVNLDDLIGMRHIDL